jgi:GNAT superfamily N-acetyltransferase
VTTFPFTIRAVGYEVPEAGEMIDTLQAYYRTLYKGPDRAPVDPAEFVPPGGMFFLGYSGSRAVAMGGWRWIEPLPAIGARRPAEIKRMYVVQDARGRGHARAILAHLESTARDAGADAIVLSTGPPQTDAIALYRSAGYVDIPPFGYYARYDGPVHLGKPLSGDVSWQPEQKS